MLKNLMLLVSVVFSVSFCLSLLAVQDFKTAACVGLINVVATFLGLVIANRPLEKFSRRENRMRQIRKRRAQPKHSLTALKLQVYQLEKRKALLIQALSATASEKHTVESNLSFLKKQLSQIFIRTSEQQNYKQELERDLVNLKENTARSRVEFHDLQTQVSDLKQRREDLYQSVRSIRAEKYKSNTKVDLQLVANLQQLKAEVAEHKRQKQELEQDIARFKELVPELKEESQKLYSQIQDLQRSKEELDRSVSSLTAVFQAKEISINDLQLEFDRLQVQITRQKSIKKNLEFELDKLNEKRQSLSSNEKQIEQLSDEWNEFMRRLPRHELQVLRALVEPGNPRAKIKKIAEENIAMPELLIDSINERAVNAIGELIVEPGRGLFPPIILEEYLNNIRQVVKLKELS